MTDMFLDELKAPISMGIKPKPTEMWNARAQDDSITFWCSKLDIGIVCCATYQLPSMACVSRVRGAGRFQPAMKWLLYFPLLGLIRSPMVAVPN
jgi:hypothetical protein